MAPNDNQEVIDGYDDDGDQPGSQILRLSEKCSKINSVLKNVLKNNLLNRLGNDPEKHTESSVKRTWNLLVARTVA